MPQACGAPLLLVSTRKASGTVAPAPSGSTTHRVAKLPTFTPVALASHAADGATLLATTLTAVFGPVGATEVEISPLSPTLSLVETPNITRAV